MILRRVRIGPILICFGMVLVAISFIASSSEPTRAVNDPTLEVGTYMEWSYYESSPDGTSWRQGIQTASVSTGTWNSEDVFMISGTIDGEYQKPDASGDESGDFSGYYRQSDLALMYSERNLHITIDGMTVTADNESFTDYDIPYLRWVKFPLRSDSPQTSWSDQELVEVNDWTVYSDGHEISSGNSPESYNYTRHCSDELTITVHAGTYDTYVVKEFKEIPYEETRVSNSTLYYSDNIGWWVKWHTYTPYDMENVLVQSLELIKVSDNGPPIASSIPDIDMNEDETYSDLDPTVYFTDPDGDQLTFNAVDTGDLSVQISGSHVDITPPSDRSGTYRFNLTATDNRHDPVKAPVTVVVNPVDDLPRITSGDVDPVQGNSETVFTFIALVKDIEGDEPLSVKVVIDGSPKTMTKISGDIAVEAMYGWSGSLDTGDHSFHFECGISRLPASGNYNGPEVVSPEEPQLYDPDLNVDGGDTNTLCSYSIEWMDQQDRDVEVFLVVDDSDTLEMLTEDTDASQGMLFTYSMFLYEGAHYYHFEAHMGEEVIRYPRNGALQGPDIFDPHIILSGYWPDYPIDGDEVTFYVHFQYGHGRTPDVQKLVVDDEEYTLSIESGDPIDGMNLTRKIKVDKGSHIYSFIIEVDGMELSPQGRTFIVGSGPDTDDDDSGNVDIDTSNEGKPAAFVVVILIVILIIVGIVAYIIVRGGRPPKRLLEDNFEENEASEGHVDRVRGL